MRVQTEEWQRFIPGVIMYKGKKTLFWNGEILRGDGEWLIYDQEERETWEVIIVLPGVEIIPENAFNWCKNIETVIMADTVRRIEMFAFYWCKSLLFVRLSRNLEYIGVCAFSGCISLTSIFIPPSCREICSSAFDGCSELIIFSVPRNTQLGDDVIFGCTALLEASSFESDEDGNYENHVEVNWWIKNMNQSEECALHRACSAYNPSKDAVYEILMQQGLPSLHKKNQIGITPYRYLQENPFADFHIDEQKLINRFVLGMMGEIIS